MLTYSGYFLSCPQPYLTEARDVDSIKDVNAANASIGATFAQITYV